MITLRNGQPAVDVKDDELYARNWRFIELHKQLGEDTCEAIYNSVLEDFWRIFAPEIATEYGYGLVSSEGRSDGWLVVSKPPVLDPAELDDCEPAEAQLRASANSAKWERFEKRIDDLVSQCRTSFYERLEEEIASREDESKEAAEMAARGIMTV